MPSRTILQAESCLRAPQGAERRTANESCHCDGERSASRCAHVDPSMARSQPRWGSVLALGAVVAPSAVLSAKRSARDCPVWSSDRLQAAGGDGL